MRQNRMIRHSLLNRLHTLWLLAGMATLLGLIGFSIAGTDGLLWAAGLGVALLWFGPRVSPRLVLRMFDARPLSVHEAPGVYQLVQQLSQRAELPRIPRLYYIRGHGMNAFSVGTRDDAGVALTDELLRRLDRRELTGVLAHEITHIRHNDMRVKTLAGMIDRITQLFSTFGQLLLLFNLPLLLTGMGSIPWLTILLLIAAPTLSGLLQLALARTREFEADLGAVRLTDDPTGLASALQKMEHYESSVQKRSIMPGRQVVVPPLLRTHPETSRRVERLLELAPSDRLPIPRQPPGYLSPLTRRPGWHVPGLPQ